MVMMIGKRSMSLTSSVAPKMTMGIEIARPITMSTQFPPAAAATAITLSRLITRSAMRMVRIASHRLSLASTSSSPSSGTSSLMPIHSSSTEPMSLSQGNREEREHDPQDDGRGRAPGDGLLLLLRRQRTGGQRDHYGVVSRQDDVDPNDLEQGRPQGGIVDRHGRGGKAGMEVYNFTLR